MALDKYGNPEGAYIDPTFGTVKSSPLFGENEYNPLKDPNTALYQKNIQDQLSYQFAPQFQQRSADLKSRGFDRAFDSPQLQDLNFKSTNDALANATTSSNLDLFQKQTSNNLAQRADFRSGLSLADTLETNRQERNRKGGGEGTVICTELRDQGFVSQETLDTTLAFKDTISIQAYLGYRMWADPVVSLMKRSKIASIIVFKLTTPWLVYAAGKRSTLGFIMHLVGMPLCAMLGVTKLQGVKAHGIL